MPERRNEWQPVAIWELLRMVKRADFVISMFVIPVLIVGAFLAAGWFRQREAAKVVKIAVMRAGAAVPASADTTPLLRPLDGYRWVMLPAAERNPAGLARAIREDRIDGAIVLPSDPALRDSVRVLARQERPGWRTAVRRHLELEARIARAAGHGITAPELARLEEEVAIDLRSIQPRPRTSRLDRAAAGFFALLLVSTVFTVFAYLSIGISGEKQARVTEVVVSAISPQAWIDGKIVAYSVLGLAQAALWATAAAIVAVWMAGSIPTAIDPVVLALCASFTVAGLVFFTSLFAMILATIKDLQSSSKFQAYLVMLPALPIPMLEPVIDRPDGPFALVVSLIPFLSPVLMPVRIALRAAAGWEIALSLALLVAAAVLMRGAAGHAFRIGMLMYGKELTLPELIRWAKRG